MIQMLEHLKLSWRFQNLSSFFWILVSSFCSGWMFISSFCFRSLMWALPPFLSLLAPCIFALFHYVAFTSSFILWPYSSIWQWKLGNRCIEKVIELNNFIKIVTKIYRFCKGVGPSGNSKWLQTGIDVKFRERPPLVKFHMWENIKLWPEKRSMKGNQ